MPLQERLAEDLKDAMRQRDELRRSTIRLIRADIQNEEISSRKSLDDAGITDILSRMVRQHHESIVEFRRGDRLDLVEREEAELDIIRQYMPQQLTKDEIMELVRHAIADLGTTGPSDQGKVMGRIMPQVRGKVDGALVSQLVAELLAG